MNAIAQDLNSSTKLCNPVRSRLILPVEDERIVARDLQMRLSRLGYDVPKVASSKAEALDTLENILPDLVLMDIQLNGIPEGIEAAREIRERFDLPVIYLTSHSDADTLEEAKVTEPFGYLLKPFDDRELLAAIETAIYKHQIERRLRETERQLRRQVDLINLSHDAIITIDPEGVITAWNAGARELYGWTESEAVGQSAHAFLQTRPPAGVAQMDDTLRRDGRWDGELIQTARNGEEKFVESRQVLIHAKGGETFGILEVNRDISDRKRAQAALEATLQQLTSALSEKTVLLREVHHRVKNNLAVISSLLGMKADATNSRKAQMALEQSQQRVRSIALIHEHLYGTDHLDRIRFGEYAQQLAGELQTALGCNSRGVSITVDAEPIELEVSRAVPCALILNELITNSLKHAFPNGRTGEVRVSFLQSSGCFELAVEDNGVGYQAAPEQSSSKSLGGRIINILTRQLDGLIEHEPCGGTRLVLSDRRALTGASLAPETDAT